DGATKISGSLSVSNFAANSPRMGAETLTSPRVELPFSMTLKGPEITIESFELRSDFATAKLAGRFNSATKELQIPNAQIVTRLVAANIRDVHFANGQFAGSALFNADLDRIQQFLGL